MKRLLSIGILMLFSITFIATLVGYSTPTIVDDDVGITVTINLDAEIPAIQSEIIVMDLVEMEVGWNYSYCVPGHYDYTTLSWNLLVEQLGLNNITVITTTNQVNETYSNILVVNRSWLSLGKFQGQTSYL